MKIEDIDKNFKKIEHIEGDKAFYAIPHPSFALHGVYYEELNECFVRMPLKIAQKVNEGVYGLSKHTAGGRLCFATDSKSLKIEVAYQGLSIMSHMPLTGSSSFALLENTDKGERFIGNLMPTSADKTSFSAGLVLPGGCMKEYILYFPLYNDVKSLAVALDKTAKVEPCNPYCDKKPILYYGSSITQGGCANRTDKCYQALICKKNRIDYINLGFSGSARGEDAMVDYLTTLDCSLFVCDYDHNAPNAEHLKKTHLRLYQRYREKRPDTPILFISKPDFRRDKEGEERCKVIRNTYQYAKRKGDKNVYFLSGKTFFKQRDSADFTVDGCHPTDYGFQRMAEEIYKKMQMINGLK